MSQLKYSVSSYYGKIKLSYTKEWWVKYKIKCNKCKKKKKIKPFKWMKQSAV